MRIKQLIHFQGNSHTSEQMERALCVWAASTREAGWLSSTPNLAGLADHPACITALRSIIASDVR